MLKRMPHVEMEIITGRQTAVKGSFPYMSIIIMR